VTTNCCLQIQKYVLTGISHKYKVRISTTTMNSYANHIGRIFFSTREGQKEGEEWSWMNECVFIYCTYHMMSHGGLQCYWVRSNVSSKFSNLTYWKEVWKKSRLQWDSKPWPLRYQYDALPTELEVTGLNPVEDLDQASSFPIALVEKFTVMIILKFHQHRSSNMKLFHIYLTSKRARSTDPVFVNKLLVTTVLPLVIPSQVSPEVTIHVYIQGWIQDFC